MKPCLEPFPPSRFPPRRFPTGIEFFDLIRDGLPAFFCVVADRSGAFGGESIDSVGEGGSCGDERHFALEICVLVSQVVDLAGEIFCVVLHGVQLVLEVLQSSFHGFLFGLLGSGHDVMV